jgi:RNA polymerase Rpb8
MEMTCKTNSLKALERMSHSVLILHHSRVFVSFGGLLLYIEGPYAKLNPLRIDYIYLLVKR